MGLITSVDYINRSLEAERKDKRQKEAEKRKNELIKNVCIDYFKTLYIDSQKSLDSQTIEILNKKLQVIKEIKSIIKEEYNETANTEYIKSNFLKWLFEAKKEFEIIDKLKAKKEKEKEKIKKLHIKQQKELLKIKKQKEEQQAEAIAAVITILATPLIIIAGIAKGLTK